MWEEGRIIQAKRNMIKKLVKTENGLFSYIYNNVSYIKRIKVERKTVLTIMSARPACKYNEDMATGKAFK